jgi:hypothetical protein
MAFTSTSRTPLKDGPFVLSAPPRTRNRAGLAVVLAVICFSAYLFLIHTPSTPSHHDQLAQQLETLRQTHTSGVSSYPLRNGRPAHRPSVKLSPAQELAAVSSFIASLPQNVIPASVDPQEPIDPQLVLDFDTRSSQAPDEVKSMQRDVWSRNPVFLYSKVRICSSYFHVDPFLTDFPLFSRLVCNLRVSRNFHMLARSVSRLCRGTAWCSFTRLPLAS